MTQYEDLRLVVAITGASGAVYGIDLISSLLENFARARVDCVATKSALEIIKMELNADDVKSALRARLSSTKKLLEEDFERLTIFDEDNWRAPIASGSFHFDAMAISPCSMKTLGKCANSIADNIAVRAAEVALKERRRLVIVPRETPLALTHLDNMRKLCAAGAVILPACPAFYNAPRTIEDNIKFITARTISAMGLRQNLIKEWGE